MNSYCGHGGEEICDKKENEKEFLNEAKREEIVKIVGALEDENFVI